ncbi:hypothetical protein [Jongsikchunia kroppenstedtii]|uniref:hypothetical protein n=1 Tax=Jongsikchunia kroppenstedtii TaxID=1121721 RepID=UPI0003801C47|nr:hypothetical protein [Jongsikchunia kroppenstedtii]
MYYEFDKSILYATGDDADYWFIDPPTFTDPDAQPADVVVRGAGDDAHFHKRQD